MQAFVFSKRKLVTLFLAALLGMASISEAKNSTWLQSESVMTAKIGRSSSIIPLGTIVAWPHTGNMPSSLATDDWCECDGREIPRDSDIVKKLGVTRTPNLYAGMGTAGKGYFLRAGATPRQVSADKFESHLHGQPPHTHSWKGQLVSTALTSHLESGKVQGKLDSAAVSGQLVDGAIAGTAAGQNFSANANLPLSGSATFGTFGASPTGMASGRMLWGELETADTWGWVIFTTTLNLANGGRARGTVSGTGQASSVTGNVTNRQVTSTVTNTSVSSDVVNTLSRGNVTNGTVSGTNAMSGGDDTYETGEDETAPTYYTTRYFMRINE